MAIRRPLVVISGHVQELPVGDSVESAPAGGGSIIAITATIDFGTVPVYSKLFEVIAPSAVTSSSFMVDAVPSSDASEMDGVLLTARCYVDGIVTVYAQAIPGPLTGLVNIRCVQILSTADLGSIAVQDSDAVAITGGSAQFTGVSSVNVNSASPALKITQAGTGNAFIVEDAASDTTPFVIDQNGRVVVNGTTVGIVVSGVALGLSVNSTASQGNALGVMQWSADTTPPYLTLTKSRGAASGTPGVVSSGDGVGTILFSASDGTNGILAARIDVIVDGTPGANDMPGRLVFSTTADGASTPTERMRINSSGRVGIGMTATTHALEVNGNAYVGTSLITGHGVSTGGSIVEVGGARVGDGPSVVDFHGVYGTDFEARIIRNGGANGSFDISNNGTGNLNIAANNAAPIALWTNGSERMRIDSAGNVTVTNAALLGYGTGAGGTVTQVTSKATAVTLNKPSGHITMEAGALAAGAAATFIVNNSLVTANDTVIPNLIEGVASSAAYRVELENTNTGLFRIRITNISAGSLSEAVVIHYNVIKGSST